MKTVKDQTVEKPGDTGAPSSGGGGDPAPKIWTITGTLRVRESELEGVSTDRALKGIEVKVQASDLGADGPWSTWGTVRTDGDGAFRLTENNEGNTRFFRVQARLVSADLTVEDGSLVDIGHLDIADRNWRTVWKSGTQRGGPAVALGALVVASGQPEDRGDAYFRRQALIWYVLRRTIDTVVDHEQWFAIGDQVKALYPARSGIATSYRNGATMHLQIDTSAWEPDTVLSYFWQAWHDFHTSGSGKLTQGWPSEAFATGFAGFATMAIQHELWGGRLKKPFSRRYVAAGLAISTMDELEREPDGIISALRLLRFDDRHGWWSHLFGTAQQYPDNRPDDDGDGEPDFSGEVSIKKRLDGRVLPDEPHYLSLWDLLHTFRADAHAGWPDDLSLGDGDDGLLRFVDRVADIHGLGDDTRAMLLNALDPLGTKEPFEWLPKSES